jgi:hypothetical protein
MSTFHSYSYNTKSIYIIISIALLLLIITTIAPIGLSMTKIVIGKIIALALVGYALYKNCLETNNLVKGFPDLFNDQRLTGIRNNALLSYTLCVTMLVLFLYVLKGVF